MYTRLGAVGVFLFVLACDGEKPGTDTAPDTAVDTGDPIDESDPDGDGWTEQEGDCDVNDAEVYPGAEEICDDKDNDCDGQVDNDATDISTWCEDRDGDGYGDGDRCEEGCEATEEGMVDNGEDCDDGNPDVHPAADETCDEIDNNCDGETDEGFEDADEDGWDACLDCDDEDETVYPGADELPGDEVDNNCDQVVDIQALGEADYRFIGQTTGDYAGGSVSSAGDVDGDGLDDVLIGAYGRTHGGGTYLLLGGNLGKETDIDLSDTDYLFMGEQDRDGSGVSVAGVGDVDGDGLGDLFIGAWENDETGTDAGKAYLVLGSSLGSETQVGLEMADASFTGEIDDDFAGNEVAGAGDVDGDGLDDLLVAARLNDEAGLQAGKIYLLRASGLVGDEPLPLADADHAFLGELDEDYAGTSIDSAGDIDGDGLGDLVIGAHFNDSGGSNSGKVYLVLSDSLLAGTTSLADADHGLIGEAAGDYAGTSVSGVGDVDGDGLSDVLVGSDGNDEAAVGAGKAYLVLGASLGSSAEIDLSEADASFLGEANGDNAGNAVSGAGDVDGDELDDLLIAAYGSDIDNESDGKVYLLLGSGLAPDSENSLADADYSFFGEYGYDCAGRALAGAGDVDGDGLDDMLVGSTSNDDGGEWAGKVYLVLDLPSAPETDEL